MRLFGEKEAMCMKKFLSVGEMVIDFLPGTEEASYIRKAGGAPANVAIAIARQGLRAAFCGMMGNDDFGHFLMDTLLENKVEVCNTKLCDEAITTMAFVTLDANNDRSFTFARKPGADMFLTREHIDRAGIEDAVIVHAGSCSLSKDPAADATRYALKMAHDQGVLVSFDVNYRNLMWNDDQDAAAKAVFEILPYVDFLKISDEEADMVGGEENLPALMEKYGISLLIETLGGKGAKFYFNGKETFVPSIPSECVDTCGAGDAFWGSFIATLLKAGVQKTSDLSEALLTEAMKRGNIGGALCVRKKGAIESIPTAEETEKFFKECFQ